MATTIFKSIEYSSKKNQMKHKRMMLPHYVRVYVCVRTDGENEKAGQSEEYDDDDKEENKKRRRNNGRRGPPEKKKSRRGGEEQTQRII